MMKIIYLLKTIKEANKLSAEESLKRLIYIVGPWTLEDHSIAEDFTNRFLITDFAKEYLPKSVDLLQSLSKQIAKESAEVKEIDLGKLPLEEQDLIMTLSKRRTS